MTALYEIVPVGGPRTMGDLRYSAPAKAAASGSEYGFVKIRYKLPNVEHEQADRDPDRPARWKFAASRRRRRMRASRRRSRASRSCSVAEVQRVDYDDVMQIASAARGRDEFGYRSEFVQMVRAAKSARTLASLGE